GPVGALAVAVAVLVAGRRRPLHAGRLLAGAGALLLVGTAAVRAAGWLFLLCLAVAVPLASLAVAVTGRSWRRAARGAVAVLFAVPGVSELVRSVRLPRGVRAPAAPGVAGRRRGRPAGVRGRGGRDARPRRGPRATAGGQRPA